MVSFKRASTNELIEKMRLQGCESVLDIGCGDGKITARLALAANQGKVLGIDLSDDIWRNEVAANMKRSS
jgi:ubiquinone/menaquinone biosynthesis C-methylase UbiE